MFEPIQSALFRFSVYRVCAKTQYHIHNYQRLEFCSLCSVCKKHNNVRETFTDFRKDSVHKTHGRISNEEYLASKPFEELPIPMQHGVALCRFQHDTTHSQLLGTSKVLNGSVLVYLAEAGEYGAFPRTGVYEDILSRLLRQAFLDYKSWLKTHKLQSTQPRFTCSRVNRKHRGSFPCLASKAINGKRVSFYLAEKAVARSKRSGATFLDGLVAVAMHSYCALLRCFDQNDAVMSGDQASVMNQWGTLHLLTYAHLRFLSAGTKGKVLLRNSFSILPKHHFLQHAIDEALVSRINPGIQNLLAAESWVGTMGKLSRNLNGYKSVFPLLHWMLLHSAYLIRSLGDLGYSIIGL